MQTDVVLVCPPYSVPTQPVLALGLLKQELNNAGISCCVDYANVYFAAALKTGKYQQLLKARSVGDFIFNEAAGIENSCSVDQFASFLLGEKDSNMNHLETVKMIRTLKKTAEIETVKTVERILEKKPKLVGCSAIFAQRNAALAILREIKKRDPAIKTFMGGFRCEGSAGLAILRQYPFVDYVYFGESDDIFADVTEKFLRGDSGNLPYGVVRQGNLPKIAPHHAVKNLDCVSVPDYSDFFELLNSPTGYLVLEIEELNRGDVHIFAETSRGCWWAEKSPCTFCGLNYDRLYRKKSPERIISEIGLLEEKYDVDFIHFNDNNFSVEWYENLLPELIKRDKDTQFFTELKSNTNARQLKMLKDAGYLYMQPGIESLSDHVLKLMNKGVSAAQNVSFIKLARKNKITITWNILTGFPGETNEDYISQYELVPKLEHLQPPTVVDVLYPSGCYYLTHPEEYGLIFKPADDMYYISPDDEEFVQDTAYLFTPVNFKQDRLIALHKLILSREVEKWKASAKRRGMFLRLDMYPEGETLAVTDTRRISKSRKKCLRGLDRDLCMLLEEPAGKERLYRELAGTDKEKIDEALERLSECSYVVSLSGKYLCLITETTRDEAYRLDYLEFSSIIHNNAELEKEVNDSKPGDISSTIVNLGKAHNYVFDKKTVETVIN